jgi:hypothetical protein
MHTDKAPTITARPMRPSRNGQRYEARLDGKVIAVSRAPFFAAARALLAQGHHPETVLAMTHEGSATVSLRGTIGVAAKLTVLETATSGPRLARYRAPPDQMLGDRMSLGLAATGGRQKQPIIPAPLE